MSLHQWINLTLLVTVLLIAASAAVQMLMRDWLPNLHDRAMATYAPQPGDMDEALERVFAEMRAALQAGCTCQDCTYVRVLLAGYGVTVGAS